MEYIARTDYDYYLDSDGTCRAFDKLNDRVDYLFSDSHDIRDLDSAKKGVIMVTSFKSNEAKRFKKVATSRRFSSIPTWSLDELRKIVDPDFKEAEIELRYGVFGGSPRNLI